MKAASLAVALATLGACAPPLSPEVAVPRSGAPAVVCEPVRLPMDGIVGCMPGAFTATPAGRDDGARGVEATVATATFTARFSLIRERPPDPEAIVKETSSARFHRVDATRALDVGGFFGRVVDGLVDERTRAAAKLVAVGDSLYTAEVRWEADKPADPHLVSVFLDSFRVEPPWRVHVSAEGGYSVALPEPAAGGEKPTDKEGLQILVHARGIGGVEGRQYAVVAATLPPADTRAVDEIFEDGLARLVAQPGRAVLKSQDVFLGGTRGREIVAKNDDGTHLRLRMFVADRRMYVVTTAAKRLEALSSVETTRFLDSFQVLHP